MTNPLCYFCQAKMVYAYSNSSYDTVQFTCLQCSSYFNNKERLIETIDFFTKDVLLVHFFKNPFRIRLNIKDTDYGCPYNTTEIFKSTNEGNPEVKLIELPGLHIFRPSNFTTKLKTILMVL